MEKKMSVKEKKVFFSHLLFFFHRSFALGNGGTGTRCNQEQQATQAKKTHES
jgi:hypothetical protein